MFSSSLVYCQVLANLVVIPVVVMNYGGVLQPWEQNAGQAFRTEELVCWEEVVMERTQCVTG